MDGQNNKNLILAMVLSMLVISVWMVLFPPPEPAPAPTTPVTAEGQAALPPAVGTVATGAEPAESANLPEAARLAIDTDELDGSINMRGARFDDLRLKQYHETIEPGSPDVTLLSPAGQNDAFYAIYGWAPGPGLSQGDVPGPNTEWQINGTAPLRTDSPVSLSWDNGKGLTFTRQIAVDDKFMFTVTDAVTNASGAPVTLQPYGQIRRHGVPNDLRNFFILHEGVVGRADGVLSELDYSDLEEFPIIAEENSAAEKIEATVDGWLGFTDHYWMAVQVPEQGKAHTQVVKYAAAQNVYQTEIRQPVMTVAAGATAETSSRFFAGAKEWATIRAYENQPGFLDRAFGTEQTAAAPIPGFIESIDWGWFAFLTKPIFAMLHWLHGLIGNMGLAIIALTFVLKLIVLPLSYKSYVSMARMKELQPEMEAIKERAGDDRQKLQKEMMQLYRDKKVNPAAGCLPILIQIPIFFSLYKVIFVTLELRHAPFFGWLNDLAAPDASSLYNFFGLLPWDAPVTGSLTHMIFIGVLPILLGITMWLQQKLNPAPTDPVQQQVFAWMPWVFMFMLGGFASGLVVYWITNNVITFTQQYLIMWSHGKRPDIFDNIRSAKKAKAEAKAANLPVKPTGSAKKGKK
ncbi:membrane protein insertase YidC [Xinfangfangia sp. CPCC 101601]|uniref:Membrane protein insertase YidC n=1 Tax=Pseudogemmobacter lacusdianii TaxID=3069608 RepID=A0ABU0W0F1_9RHOB|nr:membrane protein insertase YidC [Xinfangfangia sp. CPCC 101601]MDQ2067490.1 membrane protein insertase YidC [Xinfangfangia sp. CPCC 101601]